MNNFEKIIEKLENLNSFDIKQIVNYQTYTTWKNDSNCNNFLKFIVSYLKEHETVTSDDFYYKDIACAPYFADEIDSYLNALFDAVHNFAVEKHISNNFNLTCKDMFTEHSYCLKINDEFYQIELVLGQGTSIRLSLANNYPDYIDYNKMMKEL